MLKKYQCLQVVMFFSILFFCYTKFADNNNLIWIWKAKKFSQMQKFWYEPCVVPPHTLFHPYFRITPNFFVCLQVWCTIYLLLRVKFLLLLEGNLSGFNLSHLLGSSPILLAEWYQGAQLSQRAPWWKMAS